MTKLAERLAVAASLVAVLVAVFPRPAAAQLEFRHAFPNLRFDVPVDLAADGQGLLYVAQREGLIYSFPNDSTTSDTWPFLDLSDRVLTDPIESGLLGIAFHPEYAGNGYLYVYYIADSPLRSVIARYTRSEGDDIIADPSSELIILEIPQPTGRHNGGDITFDADGYMMVSLGDGSTGDDQFKNAQDRTTLLGSIIRIDIDNPVDDLNYGIPPDNPYAGNMQGYREEIFAYGFRNPWRFSIDPETNIIWVGDVGEVTWEKVAIARKGGNNGWPIVEGPDCYRPPENCVREDLIPPVYYYHHDVGISVTGGFVYRGDRVPELKGTYIFSDWANHIVYSLSYTGDSPLDEGSDIQVDELFDTKRFISSFGVDEHEELYMLSTFTGEIFRFKATVSQDLDRPNGPAEPSLTLRQDGPNPFNGETSILVRADRPTHVIVTAFDALGREVDVLLDRLILGDRPNALTFDGASLPAGVYFIHARSRNATVTQTVVLSR